jgi:hypothetical protein
VPSDPPPVPISLHFCDLLIVEAVTKKVSMIGSFDALFASDFPAIFPSFRVWTYLSDFTGECIMTLEFLSLDEGDVVYRDDQAWFFTDKLRAHPVFFTVNDACFPAAGTYECRLLVDNEVIMSRRLTVLEESRP